MKAPSENSYTYSLTPTPAVTGTVWNAAGLPPVDASRMRSGRRGHVVCGLSQESKTQTHLAPEGSRHIHQRRRVVNHRQREARAVAARHPHIRGTRQQWRLVVHAARPAARLGCKRIPDDLHTKATHRGADAAALARADLRVSTPPREGPTLMRDAATGRGSTVRTAVSASLLPGSHSPSETGFQAPAASRASAVYAAV